MFDFIFIRQFASYEISYSIGRVKDGKGQNRYNQYNERYRFKTEYLTNVMIANLFESIN